MTEGEEEGGRREGRGGQGTDLLMKQLMLCLRIMPTLSFIFSCEGGERGRGGGRERGDRCRV